MNPDVLKGKWHQLKGDIKTKWSRLTDDDLGVVNGDVEKLVGTESKNGMAMPATMRSARWTPSLRDTRTFRSDTDQVSETLLHERSARP
jgi:hypothetical protein